MSKMGGEESNRAKDPSAPRLHQESHKDSSKRPESPDGYAAVRPTGNAALIVLALLGCVAFYAVKPNKLPEPVAAAAPAIERIIPPGAKMIPPVAGFLNDGIRLIGRLNAYDAVCARRTGPLPQSDIYEAASRRGFEQSNPEHQALAKRESERLQAEWCCNYRPTCEYEKDVLFWAHAKRDPR